jgi:hypothetical protein
MQNRIELDFADGSYLFALPLTRIEELQRKTGVGIGALFARVLKGCVRVGDEVILAPTHAEFFALDLVETIRQGLIGGGTGVVNGEEIKVTPALAEQLIRNYVLDRPLNESWAIASSVLGACIVGYEPADKKKAESASAKPNGKTRKGA